jgi:hypothetical protein
MAELPSCYPSSASDKRKHLKAIDNIQRKWDEIKESPPALTPLPVWAGTSPISVAARKSITALSHFSMDSSLETCTCRHLPALHPVAFPTSFQSAFCWSFYRLQWRKRCSRVWAVVLPPPPHHQHLSSSRCPNRFKYVSTGACPDFSL